MRDRGAFRSEESGFWRDLKLLEYCHKLVIWTEEIEVEEGGKKERKEVYVNIK